MRRPNFSRAAPAVLVQRQAVTGRGLYELAVACDTANLIDADAALALSRAAVRTLMALSPGAAGLLCGFAEQETYRLSVDANDGARASLVLIHEALGLA